MPATAASASAACASSNGSHLLPRDHGHQALGDERRPLKSDQTSDTCTGERGGREFALRDGKENSGLGSGREAIWMLIGSGAEVRAVDEDERELSSIRTSGKTGEETLNVMSRKQSSGVARWKQTRRRRPRRRRERSTCLALGHLVVFRAIMIAIPIVHLLLIQVQFFLMAQAVRTRHDLDSPAAAPAEPSTVHNNSIDLRRHERDQRQKQHSNIVALVRLWRRNSRLGLNVQAGGGDNQNELSATLTSDKELNDKRQLSDYYHRQQQQQRQDDNDDDGADEDDEEQPRARALVADTSSLSATTGGDKSPPAPARSAPSDSLAAAAAASTAGLAPNENSDAENGGDSAEDSDESASGANEDADDPNEPNDGANNTENQCDSLDDILAARPSPPVGVILGLNYAIIFAFGLFGNVVTLYVLVCKGKSKCSVQDILIANLACSDIMLCVFAVPITPKYLILDGHWTLGSALCKVVSFAQSTSVYMSTYSLICIGYIRYRLIVHPLGESMSKQTALLSCLGTWLVGIMVTLPYMLQVRLSPENCPIKFCDEAWEKPYRFIFSLFTAFFQFMIPLGSVGFFNKKIYSRLDGRGKGNKYAKTTADCQRRNHSTSSLPMITSTSKKQNGSQQASAANLNSAQTGRALGGGPAEVAVAVAPQQQQRPQQAPAANSNQSNSVPLGNNQSSNQRQQDVIAIKEQRQREKERRMRKANNRLIFVVVIFAHSWLPLNLFNIAQDYFEAMSHWPYLTNTFLIVHQIACSSVCWNPILYAWMSETYRQDLRHALPKCIVKHFQCLVEPHQHPSGQAAQLAHAQREPQSTNSQRGDFASPTGTAHSSSKRQQQERRPSVVQAAASQNGNLSKITTVAALSNHNCSTSDEMIVVHESNFILSPPSSPVVDGMGG